MHLRTSIALLVGRKCKFLERNFPATLGHVKMKICKLRFSLAEHGGSL